MFMQKAGTGKLYTSVLAVLLLTIFIIVCSGEIIPSTGTVSAQETNTASDKLKLGLRDLVYRYNQGGITDVHNDVTLSHLSIEEDSVRVYLYTTGDSGAKYTQELRDIGLTEINASELSNVISVSTPIALLERIAELPFVLYMTPPSAIIPSVATEALLKMGIPEYHANGFTGNGVKVAIIDIQYEGLADRINEGELPGNMVTRYFRADGTVTENLTAGEGPHGVACAEIVYDIVPGADLYLIQIDDLNINLEGVFAYLHQQGVKIASMSLSNFPQWRGDGQGPLYNVIDDARQNKDILLIQSAGNYAKMHYTGAFSDSDQDGWHEFGKTWLFFDDDDIDIELKKDKKIGIYLSWDNWGNDPLHPDSTHNYDLYLYDDKGSEIQKSNDIQDGGDPPLEVINLTASESGTYHIKIKKEGVFTQDDQLRLFVTDSEYRWGFFAPVQYHIERGSLSSPSDALTSLSVAAANVSNDKLEFYSGRGPTADGRTKPDVTGYARVSGSSYGSHGFAGTSAATPNIAGLAALLLGQNPSLTADELESLLLSFALDKGDTGKDTLWGVGIAQLPHLDADVSILAPTQSSPDLVGDQSHPVKTYVDVKVTDSAGNAINGLSSTMFTVDIGGQGSAIISVRNVGDKYVLEIQPPPQVTGGLYDIGVTVLAKSATEIDAIQYASLAQNNLDVMLVIDRSGSMLNTPIENARNSAKLFVDLMNINDMIGVASFSSSSVINFPMKIINANTVKDDAKFAIDAVIAGGNTSIGAGLVDARDELMSKGSANHPWSIVLLSDGAENTSPYVASILPGVVATKIKVFAVGLGSVDEALMQDIAYQTNGQYYYTPSDLQLAEIYNSIAGQVAGRQTLYNVSDSVQQGETQTNRVTVDPAVTEAVFSLSWNNAGSNLDLTLRTPSGRTIDPQAAATDPNIEFVSGQTYEYYKIYSPESGAWTTTVHGVVANASSMAENIASVQAAGEAYNLTAQGVTNLTLTLDFDKSSYQAGDAINLQVSLADNTSVVGAWIRAEVHRPDASTDTMLLFDDGMHADGLSDDGVYSGFYSQTQDPGSYQFELIASGQSSTGAPFNRLVNLSTVVIDANDSDADGMPDSYEAIMGLDSTYNDAHVDYDADDLINLSEYQNGTDPFDWDSDNDTLSDGLEVNTYGTDPTNEDTDLGGVDDRTELQNGTDPLNPRDDRIRSVYLPIVLKSTQPIVVPNHAPYTPSSPSPANGALDQNKDVNLSWTGGDPDSDSVTYDVYFESYDATPDVLLCNAAASPFCDPGTLNNSTTYYWQVVARDEHGETTTGPVWVFVTKPPGIIITP